MLYLLNDSPLSDGKIIGRNEFDLKLLPGNDDDDDDDTRNQQMN